MYVLNGAKSRRQNLTWSIVYVRTGAFVLTTDMNEALRGKLGGV
jgi:hypothetical protein